MNKFFVQKREGSQRLDKFLAQKFPKYSRAHLQKNIKAGLILVNGKISEPRHHIKDGDEVTTQIQPVVKVDLKPDPSIALKIIYEDADLLIIDKPSGLVVHAGVKNPKNTLVNALLAHCPTIKNVGDEPDLRPGIVHRLDKDVSGVMVVAKNQKTFLDLKNQFQERKVKKMYVCLAWGKFKAKQDKIDLPLAQNPKNPRKMVVVRNLEDPLYPKAQNALTEYKVIEQFDKTAYCNVYLRTGRRHQIRVHFKSQGHPLVNDPLYGERRQTFLGTGRIFLHAASLGLRSPSGEYLYFLSPLPATLKEILITQSKKSL